MIRNIKTPHQLPNLPEEIITEILSRLPVKSLLKFRCISKSWCSLISSKHFIKTHLKKSTKNTTFVHHRIISTFLEPFYRIKGCSLHSLLCERVTYAVPFDYLMDKSIHTLFLVGSCHGLICILINKKYFFLWNPSTRKSKKLPDLEAGMKHGRITKFGFGFDESSDDYKVYGVFSMFWITGGNRTIGKIYSLKAGSWKRIEDFKDGSSFDEEGKFASGKLHWRKKLGLNSRWDIGSFDLQSEVYGVVEQPSYLEGGFHLTLGVLEGCLCVLCDYQENRLDVWVWKQYGVKDSWGKVVTIPYLCNPWKGTFSNPWKGTFSNPWKGPFSTPLCILPNGEVLFIYESTFVVYNPKDNLFWHPQIIDFDAFLEAEVYTESLVSLVPDGEQERQD